jgi:predicted RNase H-related nuclease YkuK (DUF458 family)
MRHTVFKRLGDHREVDLIPYLTAALQESDDIKIYIGSDSHNSGSTTVYATVIVLHYGTSGGHVLYNKERVDRVRDTFSRLWNEVERSLSVAEYMHENGLPKADFIDLDFNPDPKYRSNSVLRSAVGYVESMGYVPRTKPHAPAASCCADSICH